MRAKEFVLKEDSGGDTGIDAYGGGGEKNGGSKGNLHPHHKAAIKGWNTIPELPGWYYNMYRLGVHMAGSPEDQEMPKQSASANQMSLYAYTDAEQKIIDKSKKELGYKGNKLTSNRSEEPADTQKISPVAKPRKNQYGI
jgi:hypothetical protein